MGSSSNRRLPLTCGGGLSLTCRISVKGWTVWLPGKVGTRDSTKCCRAQAALALSTGTVEKEVWYDCAVILCFSYSILCRTFYFRKVYFSEFLLLILWAWQQLTQTYHHGHRNLHLAVGWQPGRRRWLQSRGRIWGPSTISLVPLQSYSSVQLPCRMYFLLSTLWQDAGSSRHR